jgi:hypothetical protein
VWCVGGVSSVVKPLSSSTQCLVVEHEQTRHSTGCECGLEGGVLAVLCGGGGVGSVGCCVV